MDICTGVLQNPTSGQRDLPTYLKIKLSINSIRKTEYLFIYFYLFISVCSCFQLNQLTEGVHSFS